MMDCTGLGVARVAGYGLGQRFTSYRVVGMYPSGTFARVAVDDMRSELL